MTEEQWGPYSAAERGAELLDEKVPGWAETVQGRIHDGFFNMRRWDTCIVGTLELMQTLRGERVIVLNGVTVSPYEGDEAALYGFVVPDTEYDPHTWDRSWGDLQRAWEKQVRRRVGG